MEDRSKTNSPIAKLDLCMVGLILPFLLFLLHDLSTRSGDLPSLLTLHLSLSQTLLFGQSLYVDYFDFAPPLVFEIGKIPYLLQQFLGGLFPFRVELYTKYGVFFLLLSSFLTTYYLFRSAGKQLASRLAFPLPSEERLALQTALSQIDGYSTSYLIALALFTIYERLQFGDVQFLLALTLTPWLAYVWLTGLGLGFNRYISIALGVAAGIASLLDYPFPVIVLFCTLAALRVNLLSLSRFTFSAGFFGLVLTLLAAILHYFSLNEEVRHAFEHWVVPLKMLSYQMFDEGINGWDGAPDHKEIFYLGCPALMFAAAAALRSSWVASLAMALVGGMLIFLLEKQGFARDLVLAVWANLALLFLFFSASFSWGLGFIKSRMPGSAGPLIFDLSIRLILTFSLFFFLNKRFEDSFSEGINPHPLRVIKGLSDINIMVEHNSKWKESVYILSDYPDPAYPLLFNLERPPGGYLLNGRPARILLSLKKTNELKGDMRGFYEHVIAQTRQDLDRKKATLILAHGYYLYQFLEEAGLLNSVDENYERIGDTVFLSDNKEPREYLGSYYALTVFKSRAAVK
ncbi:MAG: hypothetical protein K2Y32_01810 [Candidatus Obscuribacterales bacterium]|nr:hypothetical protein [Candidatus Obscuribacterales bacterium]